MCPNSGIEVTPFYDLNDPNFLTCGKFDVVYFPGGGQPQQQRVIGTVGRNRIKKFLSDGCGYVGVCAGAYVAYGLGLSPFVDGPRPERQRKIGNTTIQFSHIGSKLLQRFGVTQENVDGVPFFYASGPVMKMLNETQWSNSPFSNPVPFITATSDSVPIEANYTGPHAGKGQILVAYSTYDHMGKVLVSGIHPETNPLNFPVRYLILQQYLQPQANVFFS